MTAATKNLRILFLNVTDNAMKLQRLCALIQKHFEAKEKILIITPSPEAATYVDQLLWRQPEESFLPHAIVNVPSQEKIAITTSTDNVNQAKILINLCPEVPGHFDAFSVIYELLDRTHPAKEELSRKRLTFYRQSGFQPHEI